MFGLNPLELVIISAMLGAAPLPVGLPPLPADPVVERAAPDECLFYMSWNGTAVPDASSRNQTEQLFAEPELQQFGEQLFRQIDKALKLATRDDAQAEVLAEAVPALLKTAVMRPGAIYVSKVMYNTLVTPPKVAVDAGLVINAGDDGPRLRQAVAQLEGLLGSQTPIDKFFLKEVALKSVSLPPPAPPVVWGFKDDLFILAIGKEEAGALLERLAKAEKTPAWLKDVGEKLKIERPASLTYVNLAGILKTAEPWLRGSFDPLLGDPKVKMALDTLGISQLDYLAATQGLEGSSTMARSLLAIKGEPQGLLKLLPAKPLAPDDLRFVPRSATSVTLVRFDLEEAYKLGLNLASAFNPEAVDRYETGLSQAEQQFGLKLVDDLLKPLGDRWTMYSSSETGGTWGLVASVTLDDSQRFRATVSRLLGIVQAAIAAQARVRESEIEGVTVFTVQPSIPFFLAPTWAITKDRLIVTLNRQAMKEVLSRPSHGASLASNDDVRKALEQGPSSFGYLDTAEMVKGLYPMLQMLDPLISGAAAQRGVDFDLPLLPSLSKILPHLTPTISTMRRTDDGFYGEQWGSAPGTSMTMSIPATGFAVGLALPVIQRARERARQQADE